MNNTSTIQIKRGVSYSFLIFLTLLSLFPFLILIINSTRVHSQITVRFSMIPGKYLIQNWKNLLKDENIPLLNGLLNSVYISSCSAAFSVYFSAMTAYSIHTYRFKGRNFIFKFIMLIMMVPTQVSALGFIRLMMKMDLMNSFIPLIIPTIASPVIFFFILQYMRASLPTEIVEAARVDGSNEFRTFNEIVLPILKPALAVQAIFSFVFSWNNFFMPALIIESKEKRTIPILIANLRQAEYMRFDLGQVYVMLTFTIVPLLLVYLILSRYIIKGITLGSVKG